MLSRRQLLPASAAGLAFTGLARYARAAEDGPAKLSADQMEADAYRSEVKGYGPLVRDPKGIFDLPAGFSYAIVSQAGMPMADGLVTPHNMDGMTAFPGGGADEVILVRNHELKSIDLDLSAFGPGGQLRDKLKADRLYDLTDDDQPVSGGTTTVRYNIKSRQLVSQHLSLAGTVTNCCGGRTPWGSWLSCEETLQAKGLGVKKDHGWVFEVPSSLNGVADPVPLTGMGRFRHEAACVDPRTGIVYLTEDSSDGFGLFYRYLPSDRTKLSAGGKLQALALRAGPDADPRNWDEPMWKPGDIQEVTWIDLDGVDNPYEDLRYRGHARGGSWFARAEGIFFGQDELYFACTNGGREKLGQIMRYRPSAAEGQAGEKDQPGKLQLFVEPADPTVMNMCDNITVSPWGHLFVCEDKIGGVNYLRAVTRKGQVYTLARNAHPGNGDVASNSELAGVCFSPDGTTMFVNIYSPGMTLAVTGPWSRFEV